MVKLSLGRREDTTQRAVGVWRQNKDGALVLKLQHTNITEANSVASRLRVASQELESQAGLQTTVNVLLSVAPHLWIKASLNA